jgi:hypothetical protein
MHAHSHILVCAFLLFSLPPFSLHSLLSSSIDEHFLLSRTALPNRTRVGVCTRNSNFLLSSTQHNTTLEQIILVSCALGTHFHATLFVCSLSSSQARYPFRVKLPACANPLHLTQHRCIGARPLGLGGKFSARATRTPWSHWGAPTEYPTDRHDTATEDATQCDLIARLISVDRGCAVDSRTRTMTSRSSCRCRSSLSSHSSPERRTFCLFHCLIRARTRAPV